MSKHRGAWQRWRNLLFLRLSDGSLRGRKRERGKTARSRQSPGCPRNCVWVASAHRFEPLGNREGRARAPPEMTSTEEFTGSNHRARRPAAASVAQAAERGVFGGADPRVGDAGSSVARARGGPAALRLYPSAQASPLDRPPVHAVARQPASSSTTSNDTRIRGWKSMIARGSFLIHGDAGLRR
jgi:hypothetical protein